MQQICKNRKAFLVHAEIYQKASIRVFKIGLQSLECVD